MTDLALTDLARQFLAERRAEAHEIVTHGGEYTSTQRALAWAVLSQARQRKRDTAPPVRVGFDDGSAA